MALGTVGTNQISDEVFEANRNLIINGACNVADRGTSFSFDHASNGGAPFAIYGVDRFLFRVNALDQLEATIAQVADAPDGTGLVNSLKITTTEPESAVDADEYADFWQLIEAQNLQRIENGTSAAKATTLSFWVKSSVTGSGYGLGIYADDTSRMINATYSISSANTWEYKTVTFPGDISGSGIVNDTGVGFYIIWHLLAGSDFTSTNSTSWAAYNTGNWAGGHTQNGVITTDNATWQITGVQFEVGDVATTFEHELISTTQNKCKRYYQKLVGASYYGGFHAYTGSTGHFVQLAPTMRSAPDVTNYNVRNGSTGAAASGQVANYIGPDGFNASIDGSGGSAGQFSHINQTSMEADAEYFSAISNTPN